MSVKHRVTDVLCFEDGCRQRLMNVVTAERHWIRNHDQAERGRWSA